MRYAIASRLKIKGDPFEMGPTFPEWVGLLHGSVKVVPIKATYRRESKCDLFWVPWLTPHATIGPLKSQFMTTKPGNQAFQKRAQTCKHTFSQSFSRCSCAGIFKTLN